MADQQHKLAFGFFLMRWLLAKFWKVDEVRKQVGPWAHTRHSAPILAEKTGGKDDGNEVEKNVVGVVAPRHVEGNVEVVVAPMLKKGPTGEHMERLHVLKDHHFHPNSVSAPVRLAVEPKKVYVESHPIYCPEDAPLTPTELSAIATLQARVQDVITPHYANDPTTWVRFLRARQWHVDKAEIMLRDAIKWRSALGPLLPLRKIVSLSLKSELFNIENYDIYGRPILYCCARRHNPEMRDLETATRGIVWYMDMLWEKTLKTKHQQFVVLFNMLDLGYRNVDLAILRLVLPVLQNYYPEVIGRIIVVQYPLLIYGVWKAVKGLLDVKTQNKVQFIKSEELSEHFDRDTLPQEIGGSWDAPAPKVDLFDPKFRLEDYQPDPGEHIANFDGVVTY